MNRSKQSKPGVRKSTSAQSHLELDIYQVGPVSAGEGLVPKHGTHLYSSSPPYLMCVSLNKLLIIDTSDKKLYADYESADDMLSVVIEYSGLILVGSFLGRFYSISLTNFQCSPRMQIHDGPIIQLLVHPLESLWVASIGKDGYLKLTNLKNDKSKLKRVQDRFLLQLKISDQLSAMAFSPQGEWLLTGYENGIRAWEIDRKNLSKDKRYRKTAPPFSVHLTGSKFHQSTVERIVFVRYDVVASKDSLEGCVLLWKFDIDADTWRMSETIQHEPTLLYTVACDFSAFDFMPDTRKLIVAMNAGVIRVLPLLFDEDMEGEMTVSMVSASIQDIPGPDQPITGITCLNNNIVVSLANNCVVMYS